MQQKQKTFFLSLQRFVVVDTDDFKVLISGCMVATFKAVKHPHTSLRCS